MSSDELIPIGRDTSTEQLELALMCLAMRSGNIRYASRDLAEMGYHLSPFTLRDWSKKNHKQRYEEIQAEVGPKIRAQAAEQHRQFAEQQMEVGRDALAKLHAKLPELDDKASLELLNKTNVGAGIHADKALAYSEGVTQRSAPIDFQATLRALHEAGATKITLTAVAETEPAEPAIEGDAKELGSESVSQ